MADINEILGRQINSVKELKKAIADLQNSLIGVDTASEEYKKTSNQLAAAQAELNKVTRAGKQENDAAADSLVGLQKQYRDLYNEYKKLTEAQRNSPVGKKMADDLKELSVKINDTKKGVGDFTSNIGHYAEGVTEAFSKMGISLGGLQQPLNLVKNGSKSLGEVWKAISKNPWMAVLTVLVGILVKAAEAIKQNKELTDRLHSAMSVFTPIVNALSNAFDFLAGGIVKAVEGASKFIEKLLSLNPKMREQIQLAHELAEAENSINDARNQTETKTSELEKEVALLREDAGLAETNAEKIKLLNQAKEKQFEADQERINLAQQELDLYKKQHQATANNQEVVDELARLEKNLNNEIGQQSRNQKKLDKEIKSVTKSTASYKETVEETTEVVDSAATEAKRIYEQTIENAKDEVTKLTEKYETEKALLEAYHLDTYLLTLQYNRKMKEIKDKAAEEDRKRAEETQKALDEQLEADLQLYISANDELQKAETEKKIHTLDTIRSVTDSLGSIINTYQSMIQSELQSGKITEQQAKRKQKALKALQAVELAVTIAGIAADTAAGIMSIKANHAAYEAEVLAKYGSNPLTAPVGAGLIAASKVKSTKDIISLAAAGAAQLAAAVGGYISKNAANSDGGSSSIATVPQVAETSPIQYTTNVQNENDVDNLNVQPIYVTVTDIENGLGRKAQVTNETSF